ncbi:FG-GAP-like repeat-containing protein [Paenibacillus arenosi]|uniref:VCBS repeat-containing protein n=1 Tax=Paenibacillus arenosi TaxID=2774142 RepID=A0ABR9AXU1_9BACL|nr:FG-GAP-like repeat-containing protein [Paenibacillus arenosi]MBD8498903.1 VCBS repeat-containing protein [Paenibacillus arenosi]
MRRYHFRRIFCALLTIAMVVSLIAPFSAAQAQASQEPSDLFSKAGEFVPTESVRYLSAGNLDNQGGGDFVVVTDKCRLVLYKTKLDGTFVKECVPIYESLLPHKAEIVELTGDKQAELLVFNQKTVQIYGVNSMGKYAFKQQILIGGVTEYLARDFNNDSFVDLILATPKAMHVMQGSRGGSYLEVGTIPRGDATSIKSGDWNNDNYLDFAFIGKWRDTYVYKNNGNLSFDFVATVSSFYDDWFDFEVADMNADGYDDILNVLPDARDQTGGSIGIFYGDASATFRNYMNTRIDGIYTVTAEDMNSDGYPDLIIDWNDSEYKQTQLLWNKGGQSFSERENFTYTLRPNFIDLNGDGKRDTYYYDSYRNKVTFYFNTVANGYIQFAVSQLPVIENSGAVRVKVTRTDGNDNLAYAEYMTVDGTAKAGVDYIHSHGIIQFPHGVIEQWLTIPLIDNDERNNKKRSFSVQLSNPTRGAGLGQVSKVDIFIADDDGNEIPHAGAAPKWPKDASLTIADVSLSGLTVEWPKAATNERDSIVSYEIKEANQALEPVSVTADVYSHSWLTKLVAGKKYKLEVTAKTKKGVASLPLSASVTVPQEGYDPIKAPAFSPLIHGTTVDQGAVSSADMDGNGIDDLIITSPAQSMLIKNFAEGFRIKSETNFCDSQAGKSIDMNGDGKEEIVTNNSNQSLCVNGLDKNGKFGYVAYISLKSMRAYHAYHVADFTQDNIADILYVTHNNELILLKGGENYTFTELSRVRNAGSTIEGIISGDWNKDGVRDMAIISNQISVYEGNDNGHFEYVTQFPGYRVVGRSNDMNADGYDDIVAHSEQGFVIYYGSEQGFVPKRIENSPSLRLFDPYELLDMNHDGYVDIVLLPRYSKPMISFNDRKGSFKAAEELLNKELKYSSTIVFGDFSGDGKTDISIYNPGYQEQHITYINEQAYGQLQFQYPTTTVEEDDGHVKVKVKRAGHRSGVTSVVYGTHNGTATAGIDYVASSGTLLFADGETEKTISIPIIDQEEEANAERTFSIKLEAPTRGTQLGDHQEVAITIHDGDDIDDRLSPSWSKGAVLGVTEATYQTLTLSWPAALDVDGISTYEIVESNAALDTVTVSGDKYSYTWNSGLIAGRTYTFLLRARDKKGVVSTASLTATIQIPYLTPVSQTGNHKGKGINTIH